MADSYIIVQGSQSIGNIKLKVVDNGDGTYSIASSVAGGGGGAATVADGADVNAGSTADAAVVTDANGTLSGKLRGIVKMLAAGTAALISKWSALSVASDVFSDAGGAVQSIKALANNALKLSAALDNSANLYQVLNLVLKVKGSSAFTASTSIDFWILPSLDGTTYEDGDASTTPARPPDGAFYVRAVATSQILMSTINVIPPSKFKILLRNTATGQAFTNVDNDNTLSAYFNS